MLAAGAARGQGQFQRHADVGAPAKVIAYVYGGQGTINVPSWAPDGRRLAFLSNSDMR